MSYPDASPSNSNESVNNTQTLSVELPSGIKSGEVITIKSPDENTYYEAVVPDEATAGDTLSILCNSNSSSSSSSSSSSVAATASSFEVESNSGGGGEAPKSLTQQTMEAAISSIYTRVMKLDADYNISKKAQELDEKMQISVTALKVDAKYEISNKAVSIFSPIYRKAQELNAEHKIAERVNAGVISAEKAVISAGRNLPCC